MWIFRFSNFSFRTYIWTPSYSPCLPHEHMTNSENQGDIFAIINPFTDWKQLIFFDCSRLTWFWHRSLPHNKENVDFIFSNISFRTYIWTPSYYPCLPQQTYDKLREPWRHFWHYKSIYRLKTVDFFWLLQTHVILAWELAS